ncbi:MAG: HAMP domain-containing sensor histidine kinase, partial [Bacteroidota bacterium]
RLLAHRNYDVLETRHVRFEVEKLKTRLQLPVALDEKVEPGVPFEQPADAEVFRRWGVAVGFPMTTESSEILGFLILGEKKSGRKFTVEDIDLLNTVTTQAGLAFERIGLQMKLMLERAETQRLQELNRLKSFFVSSVSHDLKTPLTSIRMFAELLQLNKKTSQTKTREYLQIIEGESERLTRLINNVLDFAKVERGVKEYSFSEARLNEMVRVALRTLQYPLKMQKFAVSVRLSKKEHVIRADPDAVVDAVINVVSNAMKYSSERKHITVSTIIRDGFAAVRVEDRGIGISGEGLEHIFDPFYRAKDEKSRGVGGVGLGLSLVQHVMDAHGGKVEVDSKLGKGSTFTLSFPLKEGERRSRRARSTT